MNIMTVKIPYQNKKPTLLKKNESIFSLYTEKLEVLM